MPVDPALLQELQKRGIAGGARTDTLTETPAPTQPQSGGLWEELKKRGLDTKPAEKTSTGAGLWEGLKRGALDVAEQMKGLAARVPTGEGMTDYATQRREMIDITDKQAEESEQAYQQSPPARQHPIASGIGRAGGNIAASAPFAAVPGMGGAGTLARTGVGTLLGGLTGGGPGAIAGGLTGGLGGIVGPALDPAFQAIARKIPQLSEMAIGRLGRTTEAFQRSFANWVLDPIKQTVPKGIKAGEDLVNHVGDELRSSYDAILKDPKVIFRATEADPYTGVSFKDTIAELQQKVPAAHDTDLARIINNQINNRLDAGGNMSAEAYKESISNIGKTTRQYTKWNATPDQEAYGDVLKELQAHMRESLALHNPPQADALRSVDQAWSRYVRLQDAAGRRIDSNSEFLPNDLLNVAKKDYGPRAFAEAKGPLTAFGRAGNDLISQKPPNFRRYLGDAVGAGLGGAAGGAAGAAIGGPVGAGIGAAMGGTLGVGATEGLRGTARSLRSGPVARKTGEAISRMAPVAGTGGSAIDRVTKRLKAAQKVGELQTERYQANRRGDLAEVEALGRQLAEAHRDYRELGGTA
jgi:hypothetical protein